MSYQQQLGSASGLPNPTGLHDMGDEMRKYQTEALQLRDKNERLHQKLDQMQGTFTNLAHTKTDLSAQLLMTEEEKLKVSKTLVEMQIENNKIREESEAARFELTNRILQLENDLVEMEMERDKYAKAARNAKERLAEVEKDRKDLADEYVTLKSNYMALTKAHEKEVARNEELSTELMNMVNAKAALMRRLDRQLDGRVGAESPSAEVDRVRAIISRLQYRKLVDVKGSQKDRENLERSLFGEQRKYEGKLDRVKHEYEDDYRKLSSKVRTLQSELQEARRQARERGKQVSELNAQLISNKNWKENLETQNNRLQHKLKDVNDEFRSRLVKYVEDIATYIDHGGVPNKHKDDHQMKEYVTKMLTDLKRAHKVREEQLSQAAQAARKRTEDVVRKHEELLVAYRNLRHSVEVKGFDDLELGPDETRIQMNDTELVSKQQAEINRLREDLNQATAELESLKLRMRMGDYSTKEAKEGGLVREKSWANLRRQLRDFTVNTQEELEAERAELLSKNAMLEQEVQELQEYIDVHLARYKTEIVRLRHLLNMDGEGGFNSPGPMYRSKKR